MKKAQGFTLIELVVVIVILGILAATALPKFVDFTGEAEQAAAEGLAGGLTSSASIQYAASQVKAGETYSAADACDGDYLQGKNFGTCTTSYTAGTKTCAVTCGSGSYSVSMP